MTEHKAHPERDIKDADGGGATADLAVSDQTSPMDRFKSLTRRLLRVSREELQAEQNRDKAKRPESRRSQQREP